MSFVIYELRYSNIVRDLQAGIRHLTLNLTELKDRAIRRGYILRFRPINFRQTNKLKL